MQGKHAYKIGRAKVARFPLPASELRILLELRRDTALTPAELARLARVDRPTCYVVLGRLRDAELITTKHVLGDDALGRRARFADSRLTPTGKRLADATLRYIADLGPTLCASLGWT